MAEQRQLQGWQEDPFGLHEKRYFSDGIPTKLVRDGSTESFDEPPGEESAVPADAGEATAAGVAEEVRETAVTSAAPETPAADLGHADAPPAGTRAPAAVGAVATLAVPVTQADDETTIAPDAERALAQAPSAAAGVQDVPEGAVAADRAAADMDTDVSGDAWQAVLNLPGLDILRRRPRGQVYAAAAVVAVALVIGIIAITGGFSPHPQPGSSGALAQSGSQASSSTTAPLDTAAAAVVMESAQRTLAQRTAEVTLSGTATGAGLGLPLQGTGQVDFGAYAIAASLGANGGTVAENEIATSKDVYLQLAIGGRSLIIQSTGRHWMNIPTAQGADLSGNITAFSLPWSLQLLAQQPATVISIGTKSIGGVNCNGYTVTPTKQALATVVQQEWVHLQLAAKDRGAAMQALQKDVVAPITAWFDPHRQLACEMTIDMQLTNAAAPAWSKQPSAATAEITADFTHYGVPVRITAPPSSDSILF